MNLAKIMVPYLMNKGLGDDEREYMILSYLQQIKSFTFIFGADLHSIPFISLFNYNPHNSYIKLHASLGIILFLFLIPIAFHFFKELISGHIAYAVIVLSYLFRIATDSLIGSGVFTFIFLVLILYGINDIIATLMKSRRELMPQIRAYDRKNIC